MTSASSLAVLAWASVRQCRLRHSLAIRALSGSVEPSRCQRSCQLCTELALNGGPIEVCVLPRNATIGDRDHIDAVASETLALRASTHLILADEVSVADVHPAFLKANVGPLGGRGRKCCARRSDAYRRLAALRVPETRFALDHAAILYSWMRPSSMSRRRTWSRSTSVSDPGGGSSIGGRWSKERWGRCSL